jgi:predicted nucleotidyltransferase
MVNIYKVKLTNLQQEILRLLFVKAGISINARGIARSLGVSSPAVSKALPNLEKENLIKLKKDKESKRLAIELNRDNHKVMQLKRVDNIRLLYESGFVDFIEKEFAGGTIILFGSYSRGEDTYKSDIDIAIISRKDKIIDLTFYEKLFERDININFYESFKYIHKNLKENISNGIVIAGGIEI